jgi:hypothetical protein
MNCLNNNTTAGPIAADLFSVHNHLTPGVDLPSVTPTKCDFSGLALKTTENHHPMNLLLKIQSTSCAFVDFLSLHNEKILNHEDGT